MKKIIFTSLLVIVSILLVKGIENTPTAKMRRVKKYV